MVAGSNIFLHWCNFHRHCTSNITLEMQIVSLFFSISFVKIAKQKLTKKNNFILQWNEIFND